MATGASTSLPGMKIPFTLLGALVAYFVCCSAFPAVAHGVVQALGR